MRKVEQRVRETIISTKKVIKNKWGQTEVTRV